jgi:Na+/melibiose symporter-like transporter
MDEPKHSRIWIKMLSINTYWVGLSFMWNSLHVILLPVILLQFTPEGLKNTYLGALTFFGLIIAMVLQPISGAISDNWHSKWGRRRPLILIGTLFDFLFLAMLGWAGGLVWVFIGYLGLQFSSNIAHGPAQGLLPDLIPEDRIGEASGIKNFMDMSGIIVASLVVGNMLGPQNENVNAVLLVIMLVLAVFTAVTLIWAKEKPSTGEGSKTTAPSLREQLRVDVRGNKPFFWMIAHRLLFLVGIYALQSFIFYFVQDFLQAPDAAKTTGNLTATLGVLLVITALAGGWLTDRFGSAAMTITAGVLATIGYLLLLTVHDVNLLTWVGALIGAGMGFFLTANWAMANHLAPKAESGKYMGLTNLATAGAAALARLEGPGIDFFNNANQGAWYGYKGMFIFAAVCTVASLFLLKFTKSTNTKVESLISPGED